VLGNRMLGEVDHVKQGEPRGQDGADAQARATPRGSQSARSSDEPG